MRKRKKSPPTLKKMSFQTKKTYTIYRSLENSLDKDDLQKLSRSLSDDLGREIIIMSHSDDDGETLVFVIEEKSN